MTKKAFDKIMEGLTDALAHASGEDVPSDRVHIPAEIDVKAIRAAIGLSQVQFAEAYGFSLGAVRDWEQGRRVPDQSTRAFLKVIAAEPLVVSRVLQDA